MKKKQILIADDEKFNIDILIEILEEDYKILIAKNGQQVFKRLEKNHVDLILLDIVMPDIDGYEVCRMIKEDEKTCDIPVIFITALSNVEEESRGFESGAVDYITKPISPSVVKARVRNQIVLQDAIRELRRLNSLALDANPNTGLPGNNSIATEINRIIRKEKNNLTVVYADLDNFKAYNDKYGFARGDEVIIFTSNMINQAINEAGCSYSFTGHIGGDDFVFIIPSDKFGIVAEKIIAGFDGNIKGFYSDEDLEKNGIEAVDREGEKRCFPIITISMGAVNLIKGFRSYLEVADACTETKRIAKNISGSSIFVDRREP